VTETLFGGATVERYVWPPEDFELVVERNPVIKAAVLVGLVALVIWIAVLWWGITEVNACEDRWADLDEPLAFCVETGRVWLPLGAMAAATVVCIPVAVGAVIVHQCVPYYREVLQRREPTPDASP